MHGQRETGRKGRRAAGLALAGILLVLLLTGCTAEGPLKRYQLSSVELFDTVTMITGYAESEAAFRGEADALLGELREYHQLCDAYHTYPGISNLKTINDAAGGAPIRVDARLLALLQFAKELAEETRGTVDVTLGPVLRLWHAAREQGLEHPETAGVPERAALEAALAHCGWEHVELDEAAGTVRLTDPEAALDLGAVAKGYAAQRVCETRSGSLLVNLGGNVCATGPKPDGEPWTVGIQDPDGTGSDYLQVVTLSRGAVVTSGDYQRYYEVAGVRYHHLIDPETLEPGRRWRAVTVLHEDSGLADGLSTALFLMDREQGEALLRETGGEALWISPEGEMLMTDGYAERMRSLP